jgi:hypothetical protein
MSNLPETSAALDELNNWIEGIYQLETDDVVEGGPDGIDNLQAKKLLARINLLKTLVLALGTDKQPVDALLTALAALVTSADKTIYFTGPDTVALTPLTAYIRGLFGAADAAAARATLGATSPADVASAVAALVDSSPATLNTLNELATALGDDPNFAATVTAALGQKAPLASPALTGVPTAPTADPGTNTTQLATTAFIQAAIAAIAAAAGIQGSFRNLAGAATGTSAVVSYSIDELTTGDGAGNYQTTRAWNKTITMTTAGAGGLDTGAVAANTWYYAFGITKADGTQACIASLNSTAPILSGGYTKFARIGAFRTDGTANKHPLSFKQFGRSVQYVPTAGSNLLALPVIQSGNTGNVSTPTWTAVSLSAVVPATASAAVLSLGVNGNSSAMVAPNNSYGGLTSATNPPPVACCPNPTAGYVVNQLARFYLESANVYVAATGSGTNQLAVFGWEDNL